VSLPARSIVTVSKRDQRKARSNHAYVDRMELMARLGFLPTSRALPGAERSHQPIAITGP
jgi:hypothetical protein